MTTTEPERPALTEEWYALPRADRLRDISKTLGIDPRSTEAERLSSVPPSAWTTSLRQREAAREYGFPAEPTPSDDWTAWDGSIWTFSDLVPWWNLTRKPEDDDSA